MDGPWTLISGAGVGDIEADNSGALDDKASDAYSPAKEIVGMYLRATVTYTDKHGDDKTAMEVSAHMRSGQSPQAKTHLLCSLAPQSTERWTRTRRPARQ